MFEMNEDVKGKCCGTCKWWEFDFIRHGRYQDTKIGICQHYDQERSENYRCIYYMKDKDEDRND